MVKKSANKTISPQELRRMWKSVNLPHFWEKVAREVSKGAEAYRIARVKSREKAASTVLI